MAVSDNRYSRFVNWLKIMLPLGALALLSTLFLFARNSGSDPEIPYAEIEEIAREPRISEPAFAGIAEDGSVVAVTARTIWPDPDQPDSFAIADLVVSVDAIDGSHIDVTSGEGRIDGPTQIVQMTELVRLTSSSGYSMETSALEADMKAGILRSNGPLAVRAPFGDLTAGGLIIQTGPENTGSQMVFNNGVRLLYQPQP